MAFNYGLEKKKFDEEWGQTARFYASQGMSMEAIEAMREFDWNVFKGNRIEALHTQSLNPPEGNDNEGDEGSELLLLRKFFERFTSEYDTYGTHSRYWWIEEWSTPCLVAAIPHLTDEDKELLTLYIIFGFTTREIAKKLNTYQMDVSRKLQRILGYFRQ